MFNVSCSERRGSACEPHTIRCLVLLSGIGEITGCNCRKGNGAKTVQPSSFMFLADGLDLRPGVSAQRAVIEDLCNDFFHKLGHGAVSRND